MSDALHLSNEAPADANPLEDRIRESQSALFRDLVAIEEEAASAPDRVDTDEAAATLTDLAGRLQKLEKAFDAAKTEEKKPYLEGGRTVDAVLGGPVKQLEARRKALLSRVNALHERRAAAAREAARVRAEEERWAAEEARRAAEAARAAESHQEADQLAQEAAKVDDRADALDAKAAKTTGAVTRTESGASSYQVREAVFDLTDPAAFRASFGPMAPYLDKASVAAALGRAAADGDDGLGAKPAKAWPDVPGVTFSIRTRTQVRNARS